MSNYIEHTERTMQEIMLYENIVLVTKVFFWFYRQYYWLTVRRYVDWLVMAYKMAYICCAMLCRQKEERCVKSRGRLIHLLAADE